MNIGNIGNNIVLNIIIKRSSLNLITYNKFVVHRLIYKSVLINIEVSFNNSEIVKRLTRLYMVKLATSSHKQF